MTNLEKIFYEYRSSIMQNSEFIKKLSSGKLPYIKGFSQIKKIIEFYNLSLTLVGVNND